MSLVQNLLMDTGQANMSDQPGMSAGGSSLGGLGIGPGNVGSAIGSAIGSLGGGLGAGLGAGLGGSALGFGPGQAAGAAIGTAIGSIAGPAGSLVGGLVGGRIGENHDNARADRTYAGTAPGEVEANDNVGPGADNFGATSWGSSSDGPMGSYAGDMGGSGGGGGDGGGGTVICTELYLRGLIGSEHYDADIAFGKSLPFEVIDGYHLWARPVVRLMKRSPLAMKIVYAVARPWIAEMVYRQAGIGKGSVIGAAMLFIGIPICHAIGWAHGRTRVWI
jgi:hypothetical protein